MFRHMMDIPWRSIRVKLVLGLLSITIPLIALLLYNNNYSVKVIHNQVAMSNKNLISIHMKQIDDQLSEVERHMVGLAMLDSNLHNMEVYETEDDYVMAKSGISRRLDSDLIIYPYIEGFFVYSLSRNEMVNAYNRSMGYSQLTNFQEVMKNRIIEMNEQSQGANMEWSVININGINYISRWFRNGDIYIGAWVKADTILAPLRVMHTNEAGGVLIVNSEGEILSGTTLLAEKGLDFTRGFQNYYLSGKDNDYLIVGETSRKGDFSMAVVFPDKQILENLPYLANAAKFVIAMAILMLLLSTWFLRKVLMLPLHRMMVAMRAVGKGDLYPQIEDSSAVPDEFQLVNRTFNQMIKQIEDLKISVYEEQLSKHRAELKHLQLQINPHFFMNSLNIIYNLAQVKQHDLIQEMTMCLVQYFRYMFQSNHSLVLLRDELRHIQNYLRIQQMRMPNRFTCEIHVPNYLEETLIPPLILQTFVENTIKHAITMDGMTAMTVEATLDMLEEEPMVRILTRDTGKGFPERVLETIHSGKQLVDEKGAHIGLWNARERLRLQFGDRAWMELYNDDPQGAIVELVIPLKAYLDNKEGTRDATSINRG
ncbi:MAG: histidine kinase [Candidatus Pristimantibacillus lignocellulolyticus]|uniref:Histidine kinase n=1 Tax=Candidatus Pristimantibacillus lignocellulolyticus TaxID=2994561 RepID=A0A9J6ZG23_9BACL|nr:MAG: histidine kinase [Candidatus Pristimantibacillus lignocellulolyticus]